jgi:hypothetical protein
MDEENSQNTHNKSGKSNKGSFAKRIGRKNAQSKQTEAKEQKKYTTDIKKEANNITVNIVENKDKTATWANRISFMNMLITAAMTLFTYLLFAQTKITLDEYKKEFEEVNRPDVIIANFNVDTTESQPVRLSFHIINTGRFRAKIRNFIMIENLGKDTSKYTDTGIKKNVTSNELLQYNADFTINEKLDFTPKQKYDFINGTKDVFLVFDYEYYSDILKKSYATHLIFNISFAKGSLSTEKVTVSEIVSDL